MPKVLLFLGLLLFLNLLGYLGCNDTEKTSIDMCDEEYQKCFPDQVIEVTKPQLDDREYVFAELENGLSLLTISHIGTETSAASLAVQVGSFQNPDDCLGLAHFLEHMIFMGTKKYPNEREFIDFIQNNFGSRNGVTQGESTTYYFDIPSPKFEPALDRFSQFFIEPLLLEDAIEREMNAVHSEYEKNIPSDAWRALQIFREISSPSGHPATKFSTGSLETLNQTDFNIRERLVEFFESEYSSDLMYLVLYGNETTEVLQTLGKRYFSRIKKKKKRENWNSSGNTSFFHPPTMKQKIIQIVPVKDKRELSLCFPVDDLIYEGYRNQSSYRMISHLFENNMADQGTSLYDYLVKEKTWVTSLSSGMDMRWEGQGVWCVEFSLSVLGDQKDHVDEIIKSVFEYIQFLKTMPKNETIRIFEELQHLSQLRFDFKGETRPANICPSLSRRMMKVRPEDILKGLYYPYSFEYSSFQEEISIIFNIDQLFCFWTSRVHEQEEEEESDTNFGEWKIEKYLQGKYRTINLSKILIENLNDILSSSTNISNFEIPSKNEYIPQNLELVEFLDDSEKEKNTFPRIIFENENLIQFFFKQDTQFHRPKSSIIIRFHVPEIAHSSKNWILANLFSGLVEDFLDNTTQFASVAGLSHSFHVNDRLRAGTTEDSGFELVVLGWSDTLFKLLELIIHTISEESKLLLRRERFEIFKEEMVRKFGNVGLMSPYQYAMYVSSYSLISSPEVYFHDELFNVSKDEVNFRDLEEFFENVISRDLLSAASKFTVLMMGNHRQYDVLKKIVEEELLFRQQHIIMKNKKNKAVFEKTKVVKLDENKRYVLSIPSQNPNDTTNNCLVMSFQVGTKSQKLDMITSILGAIMSPIVFDALRTKEQLGYIVSFRFSIVHNVYYGQFVLQSSETPITLSEKVRSFVKNSLLDEVKDKLNLEFFKEQKELLRQKYEENKPKSIFEETSLAWKEISTKQFRFNRYEEYIEKLDDDEDKEYISVADVLEFFETTFLGEMKSVFEVRLFSEDNWEFFKGSSGEVVEEEKVVFSEDIEFLRSLDLDEYPDFVMF